MNHCSHRLQGYVKDTDGALIMGKCGNCPDTCMWLANLICSPKWTIVSHSEKCFPFGFLNLQKTTSGL